jgi:metal-responsive CopG/Arc/MetJ family transcriptional regulator
MERTRKKRPGRPSGTQYRETIPVRLTKEAAAAVDRWAAEQNERGISRSEAIRRLVDQALASGQKLDAGTVRAIQDAIASLERTLVALRRLVRR